ncbi:MAG: hypothetical protein ACEQR7_10240, partial [Agathobacter rectalis]
WIMSRMYNAPNVNGGGSPSTIGAQMVTYEWIKKALIEKRKEEYFVSKLERLKSMVKRPLEDCSPIYMKAYTSSPSWKRSGQSLLM